MPMLSLTIKRTARDSANPITPESASAMNLLSYLMKLERIPLVVPRMTIGSRILRRFEARSNSSGDPLGLTILTRDPLENHSTATSEVLTRISHDMVLLTKTTAPS